MAPYGPSLRLGLIAYYTSADRRTRSRDDTAHLTTPFSIRRPRSSRCRCAAFGKRKPNVRYQKGRKMNDLIHRINNNVFLLLPLQSINEREIKNDLMTRSAEPQLLPPRHFFVFFSLPGNGMENRGSSPFSWISPFQVLHENSIYLLSQFRSSPRWSTRLEKGREGGGGPFRRKWMWGVVYFTPPQQCDVSSAHIW